MGMLFVYFYGAERKWRATFVYAQNLFLFTVHHIRVRLSWNSSDLSDAWE